MNCIDDSRLEQLLQLKKEIRGSDQDLIVSYNADDISHCDIY